MSASQEDSHSAHFPSLRPQNQAESPTCQPAQFRFHASFPAICFPSPSFSSPPPPPPRSPRFPPRVRPPVAPARRASVRCFTLVSPLSEPLNRAVRLLGWAFLWGYGVRRFLFCNGVLRSCVMRGLVPASELSARPKSLACDIYPYGLRSTTPFAVGVLRFGFPPRAA
jgi:hypothetical protein